MEYRMEFRAWEHFIERVCNFKHLCRMLSFDDSNWPAISGNIQKTRKKLGRFHRMIVWEGGDAKTSVMFMWWW